MFVILGIKFHFAIIKWGLCQSTEVPKHDQPCRENLYKYRNFHGILSFKSSTCKYVQL